MIRSDNFVKFLFHGFASMTYYLEPSDAAIGIGYQIFRRGKKSKNLSN